MYQKVNTSLFVVSIVFMALGNFFLSLPLLVWGLLFIFVSNFLYALSDIKKNVIFMFFNITFFIFLLGRIFVAYFFGYNPLNMLLGLDFYDLKIVADTVNILYLSLQFMFIGFYVANHVKVVIKHNPFTKFSKAFRDTSDLTVLVRKVSKYICYITFVFRVVQLIDIFQFVKEFGYNAFYISYESALPMFVGTFASFFSISFFIFIATLPTKKELILPITFYLIEAVFSLGTGQRNIFALNVLIIAIYLILRMKRNISVKEINKKYLSFGALGIMVILFIFIIVGNLRWGINASSQSVFSSIARLFFDQGVSANLIGYTMSLEPQIPNGNFYSFGPFIRLFKDLASVFTDIPTYDGQTVENALSGDAFTYLITYLIMPFEYMQGRGYGSSYIAELFADFAIYGVIVGNLFYGFLTKFFTVLYHTNFIIRAYTLLLIRYFIFTPRAGYLDFITYVFSVSNIVYTLAVVYICYLYMRFTDSKKLI